MNIKELIEYLDAIDIDDEERAFTINFYKKERYKQNIMQAAISDMNNIPMSFGYGNINSNICFIFNNIKEFNELKPTLIKMLSNINMELWSIYVTFINKTNKKYTQKLELLVKELSAVRPKIIYFFQKNKPEEDVISCIERAFNKINVDVPSFYHVPPDILQSNEQENKNKLWSMFKYMINYKNKTKR